MRGNKQLSKALLVSAGAAIVILLTETLINSYGLTILPGVALGFFTLLAAARIVERMNNEGRREKRD